MSKKEINFEKLVTMQCRQEERAGGTCGKLLKMSLKQNNCFPNKYVSKFCGTTPDGETSYVIIIKICQV